MICVQARLARSSSGLYSITWFRSRGPLMNSSPCLSNQGVSSGTGRTFWAGREDQGRGMTGAPSRGPGSDGTLVCGPACPVGGPPGGSDRMLTQVVSSGNFAPEWVRAGRADGRARRADGKARRAGAQSPLRSPSHPHWQAGVISDPLPGSSPSLLRDNFGSLRQLRGSRVWTQVRRVPRSASRLRARCWGAAHFRALGPLPSCRGGGQSSRPRCRRPEAPCARGCQPGLPWALRARLPGRAAPSQASRRVPRLGLKGLA